TGVFDEALRICKDLRSSPGAPARWLSRRSLAEGEGRSLAYADFVGALLIRMPVVHDARTVQMRVKSWTNYTGSRARRRDYLRPPPCPPPRAPPMRPPPPGWPPPPNPPPEPAVRPPPNPAPEPF